MATDQPERKRQPAVGVRKLKVAINPDLINKNESGDPRLFAEGFENVEATPAEFAKAINFGMAFCCQLDGSRRHQGNFLCSDVLSIDIDGELRLDEIESIDLVRKHLTILYTTPSHTQAQHRFRLVFALDRTIDSAAEMRAALRSLTLALSGDLVATDPARISYGSTGSDPRVFERSLDAETLDSLIKQGLRADVSDSASSRTPASTVSRLRIKAEDLVRTSTGQTKPFSSLVAGERVHCPFHNDRNPSAFITTTKTGAKCLHCSTCYQTFFQAGINEASHDFSDFERTAIMAHDYFKVHGDYGPFFEHAETHVGLTDAHIYLSDDAFFSMEKLKPGLTLVKSPKGTGKTEVVAKLIGDDSTLLIGHRRSLIRQSCSRLGLECYLDLEPGRIRQHRLGICLDSLDRLVGTGDTTIHSTIVIDESEQVLGHFLADTLTKGESQRPRQLFKLFSRILFGAKRVIALDADLGWTTFETLRRIVNPAGRKARPVFLHINKRGMPHHVQIFDSDKHLTEDLFQALQDGNRAFVTSNSKRRIHKLESAMAARIPELHSIAITSETIEKEAVRSFLRNPVGEILQYDLILTSPTVGTGVDITFEGGSQEIDVVYGFCEPRITTHFDFDQQVGRVRNPKQIKIWVTPETFNFDTSRDVIRSDLQKRGLFETLLVDFDKNLNPVHSDSDSFLDMASLVVSQQRASKNRIRRHFFEYKKSQGYEVHFIPEDALAAELGDGLLKLGRLLSHEQRIQRILNARSLSKIEFDQVDRRLTLGVIRAKGQGVDDATADTTEEDNFEYPTEHERWCLERTRLELFYRQIASQDLVEWDAFGRMRSAVCEFERLQQYQPPAAEFSEFGKAMKLASAALMARFLKTNVQRTELIFDLLSTTPLFANGSFFDGEYTSADLTEFVAKVTKQKAAFENLLDIEVRADFHEKPMRTLGELLKSIGLRHGVERTTKAPTGKKIYYYALDMKELQEIEEVTTVRAELKPWDQLYEFYGWDVSDLGEDNTGDSTDGVKGSSE